MNISYHIHSEIENWDVSQVDDMASLFYGKDQCNPNIGSWNVSNVTSFVSDKFSSVVYNHLFKHNICQWISC